MKVSPVGHNSPLFCHIFGLNNALKALADPPHFSPEIGATETSKKSPEAAETMASLGGAEGKKLLRNLWAICNIFLPILGLNF